MTSPSPIPSASPLWSIQKPIIASFVAAFALLLFFFHLSLQWMHVEQEEHLNANFQNQVSDIVQLFMRENYRVMEGELLVYANNHALVERFLSADRQGIVQIISDVFDRIKRDQAISHFYFHDPQGINFLRVHDPERFGDRIDRHTMRQAQTTGQLAQGLELGPNGTLTQRVVMPWMADGQLIGYLEMGKELSSLLTWLDETLHVDFYLFIHKKFLNQAAWHAWRVRQGQSSDWDQFPDVVLACGTRSISSSMIDLVLKNQWNHGKTFDRNDGIYSSNHDHYFFIQIPDSVGNTVAQLGVMFGDQPLEKISTEHKKRVIIGIALIALFLGLLFYRLLLWVEKNLRQATDELRNSEQRNRAILDTALDAIISIDTDGCIFEFNKAAERIFGFKKKDLLGKEISQFIIPPELRDSHRQGLARYLATGQQRVINQHIELEALNVDGQRIPIEIAITVIPGAAFPFFTAYVRDISERKQMLLCLNDAIGAAEASNLDLRQEVMRHEKTLARLQASEEKFRSVTLSIRDAIIAADTEQNIIFWNRGAEVLFGYERHEILGKQLVILIPERFALAHQQGFQRFIAQGHAPLLGQTTELAGLHKSGQEFPLEMSLNSWTNTDGTRFFSAVIRDITERKNSEAVLLAAKENAEAANQAKSLFLANMSHEIRTPMNTIIGMGYLLAQTQLTPNQQSQIRKIQFAAETLLGIINNILDFSKIEAGRLELEHAPFHLGEVMEKVAAMVSMPAVEKGVEILFALPADLPHVLIGDALRLEQILVNLGTNAVKFTPSGEVVFRIALLKTCGEHVQLEFVVQDSGIGLTEEQIAGLFQPFVQADCSTTRNYGGTGLGLAICKNLVDMMGGVMRVNSVPGSGSAFSFTLSFERQSTDFMDETRILDHLGSLRVLVVDDNESARDILQQMLRGLSLTSVVVDSGPKAIIELERVSRLQEPPYDVVFLDWQMPEMNGMQTVSRIRNNRNIKKPPNIIMVTAFGKPELMKEARDLGVKGFLLKPVTSSMLLDTLSDIYGKVLEPSSGRMVTSPGIEDHRALLRGARILVVEDHEINWQVAEGILTKVGIKVERAVNGLDAVKLVSSHPNAFDAVLMDLQMPVMDGYEATRILREQFTIERLPIVAMTANALKSEKDHCLSLGMNDYLTKPIKVDQLFSTLASLLPPVLARRPVGVLDSVPTVESATRAAETSDASWHLEGIDIQEALERLDGDEAFLIRLLVNFANMHATTGKRLAGLLATGDLEGFKTLLHGLKGVAGNISAYKLASLAAGIEKMARNQDVDACKIALDVLCRDLDVLIQAIEQLHCMHPTLEQVRSDSMEEDEPFPVGKLVELRLLLEEGDFQAREVFAAIQKPLARHVDGDTIALIQQSLETLEFGFGATVVANLLHDFGVLTQDFRGS
ncbi:MAG: PAS domain S-box protein [Magnetococcus sp. YQC-5]